MVRVPNPNDLPEAGLQPSMRAAQINIGAASNIGAGGRAIGAAIADVGSAFGQIAGRMQQANDKQNDARFQIDWLKSQDEIWNETRNSSGEDGSGWDGYTQRLESRYKELDEKYPITGEDRRLRREMGVAEDILKGGRSALKTKLEMARSYYTGIEKKELDGIVQKLGEDPSSENYERLKAAALRLVESGEGTYYTRADVERRQREVIGAMTTARIAKLIDKDPAAATALIDKLKSGRFEIDRPPQPSGGAPNLFIDRTPTPAERAKIFRNGGVVVNLDTNWSESGQTSPMVVIPDGATPQQRQAAQAYAERIAEVYKQQFGTSLAPRVVTRSQNGRGRAHTIHTEPYSVNDEKAVQFFNGEEGRRLHAQILQETLGRVPGVHFSLPHDPYRKGDNGAKGRGGSEVDFARGVLELMKGGGVQGGAQRGSDTLSMIVNAEARRDGQGRLKVDKLPDADGGGRYEVAGINERYHPQAAAKLAAMIERGQHADAEAYAKEYIGKYTQRSAELVQGDALQYVVRDMAFNRGPGGANAMLRMAIGGTPDSKTAAHKPLTDEERQAVAEASRDPKAFIERMTAARELYESKFVGHRPQFAKGLRNRWQQAKDNALGLVDAAGAADHRMTGEHGGREAPGLPGADGAAGMLEDPAMVGMARELFGDDAQRIIGIAQDDPNGKLKDYVDGDVLKGIADRLGVDPGDVTLGEALNAARALDRPGDGTDPDVNDIPMGRLQEGQVFEIDGGKLGPQRFTAEEINTIDKSMLRQFARTAREQNRIRIKQQVNVAEDLMNRQLATVEQTGKSVPDYDPSVIQQAFRGNPKKIRQFNERLAVAKMVHGVVGDMHDVDNDTITDRLADLEDRISADSAGVDPEALKAYRRAEKAVQSMIKLRTTDPARAVDRSAEVRAVKDSIPRGSAMTAAQAFQIVDARMKAQARLGIPRTTVTRAEADTILADIVRASPKDRRAVAQEVLGKLQKVYGSHAKKVMEDALFLSRFDRNADLQLINSTMRRMERDAAAKLEGRPPSAPAPPVAAPAEDDIDRALEGAPLQRGNRLPVENPFMR